MELAFQKTEEILGRPLLPHEKNLFLLARKAAKTKIVCVEIEKLEQRRQWLNKKNSRPRNKLGKRGTRKKGGYR